MAIDFGQLMRLWSTPLPEGVAARAAFGAHHADPVRVNGAEMSLAISAGRYTTVVFKMRGRHVGPLATPLGEVAPTGKVVERQIIDLLGERDGRIDEVWMVGDERGALARLGVIRLVPPVA